MITTLQKNEIIALIEREKTTLGSYSKVANKCGVAVATITNNALKSENWHLLNDAMWTRIGKCLGFSFSSKQWVIAETTNYKMMCSVLDLAQSEAMFMAVAYHSESGKSASSKTYKTNDKTNSVFYIECKEWSRKVFLTKLAQNLGINLGDKYHTNDSISEKIIDFLKQRTTTDKPLLIIDQANSLKQSALRWFIDLYNELEDQIGCVIVGTDALEISIKKGVAKYTKGFDEIDSRFGRKYIKLQGNNIADMTAICTANGITDSNKIKQIWAESEPKEKLNAQGKYEYFVENIRRVKRIIEKELKFLSLIIN